MTYVKPYVNVVVDGARPDCPGAVAVRRNYITGSIEVVGARMITITSMTCAVRVTLASTLITLAPRSSGRRAGQKKGQTKRTQGGGHDDGN